MAFLWLLGKKRGELACYLVIILGAVIVGSFSGGIGKAILFGLNGFLVCFASDIGAHIVLQVLSSIRERRTQQRVTER